MEGAAREGWAGVGIVLYLREVVLTRIYVHKSAQTVTKKVAFAVGKLKIFLIKAKTKLSPQQNSALSPRGPPAFIPVSAGRKGLR